MASQVRTGGKGSMRRKTKIAHHTSFDDRRKIETFIQANQCHELPSVDEIQLFLKDSSSFQFIKPKVFANIGSNLTVIQGKHGYRNEQLA
ncbi:putative nascent polypeptide-associated complex subunit beta [Monocercomonoides exilis]|uniref:putative nascent polypeptide-associated complex subunit beta n=1 Tax=Monocercomonoides exilis TaxID=2049356 RepID=UPI00355A37DD|nr:putative nascent polypeptide-associated complex subunit beta [Monocercomonoides exilis]